MHSDHTKVTLFDEAGEHALPAGLKSDVANQIIQAIADRMI